MDVDNHKLIYHPSRIKEWMEKGDCFPIYVEIGPTSRCNHRCSFCALDWIKERGSELSKEVMTKNLENMSLNGVKSIMFAGEGEPFLHKNLTNFIFYAKEFGLDVAITTNGSKVDYKTAEECLGKLSWIRFSINGGQNEYPKIHGVKGEEYEKVMENLNHCVKIKKNQNLETTIGVQCLLIPENVKGVTELVLEIKKIGADNIQIKPYSHHPSSKNNFSIDYSKLSWLESELKKYEAKNFKVFFRRQTMERIEHELEYNSCYGLPFFALIDSKGNIIPCNLFYNNSEFSYGNINENLFSEIWKGDRRKEILRKINHEGIKNCRKGCRLDPINRYLQRLKNPQEHDNFI